MCLYAYLCVQIRRWDGHSLKFAVTNLISSVCIVFSLLFFWNFPSFLIEFFWALISLLGIARCLHARKKKNTTTSSS